MTRSMIAAAVISAFSFPATHAAGSNIIGVGTTPCPEVAAAMDRPVGRSVILAWAGGFMSGANVMSTARDNRYRDLTNQNPDVMAGSIRAFCAQHPDAVAAAAVEALFAPLPTQPFAP